MECSALRFSNKGQSYKAHGKVLYNEALNETGTVETTELSDSNANLLGGEYQKQLTVKIIEQEFIRGMDDKVLEVHR